MKKKWTLLPIGHAIASKLLRRSLNEVKTKAVRRWELAPSETTLSRAAFFLPNQLSRITGWRFIDENPAPKMAGRHEVHHAPTAGYLVENVWLLDGMLHKGSTQTFVAQRTRRVPPLCASETIDSAALYCSSVGNLYFGSWLIDDCPTYLAATDYAPPATVARRIGAHEATYEQWFSMSPRRLKNAFIRRLYVFDDFSQNSHKRVRFERLKARVQSQIAEPGSTTTDHAGVYIVRGKQGARRLLHNELEVAEALRTRRGFRIVDPMTSDVATIAKACAGARMIVGVEGSALIHGMLALGPERGLLTLQPPNRFVSVFKNLTDRDDQHFGFVVGTPAGPEGDFSIDIDEIERTLDLFPATTR